jgi:hypothetical protein
MHAGAGNQGRAISLTAIESEHSQTRPLRAQPAPAIGAGPRVVATRTLVDTVRLPRRCERCVRTLLAIPLVVLAVLIGSACATAGAPTSTVRGALLKLNGVYRARVESEFQSGALNGVWRLRLDNGVYTFNYTGTTAKHVIISGVYTAEGRRITFRDHSTACSAKPGSGGCRFLGCREPATYRFTLIPNKLVFARLRDRNMNCELPLVLSSEFHRVG